MFDAQQYLDALSPPQFKDTKGRVHTGRLISYEEFLPFQRKMQTLATAPPSDTVARTIIRSMVGLLFPKPWWKFWRRSVTAHVLRLPPPAAIAAMQDFSQSLAKMYKAADREAEAAEASSQQDS